jgi:hypothetical protein
MADSPFNKDRVIADTGWGIKPDDQPSNVSEARSGSNGVWKYDPADPDVLRKILLAQRRGFNTANKARVEATGTTIYDINGDGFIIEGLGYGDENLITLLQRLGAAFDPQDLRKLTANDVSAVREYPLSRAWAWGAERPAG